VIKKKQEWVSKAASKGVTRGLEQKKNKEEVIRTGSKKPASTAESSVLRAASRKKGNGKKKV